MRRLAALAALAAVCAAVVVILVDGRAPERPVSALDDALGYFPEDAPLVAAAATDPQGPQGHAFARILGRFDVVDPLVDGLIGQLGLREVDFNRDLAPQLGRPLAVGVEPGVYRRTGRLTKALVIATRIRKPTRMKQLLVRQPSLLPRTRSHGRRIWENRFGGGTFAAALDGDVLLAGGTRAAVAEALGSRRSKARMRETEFDATLAPLPRGAGLRVSADPRALLAGSRALRGLLGIKWIAALRRSAAAVTAEPDGIALDFRIRTDPELLTDAELPLSPRRGPLPLIGSRDELAVGVRGPGRLVRLAAAIARRLDPRRAARADHAAKPMTVPGQSVDMVLAGQLGRTASVAVDPVDGSFAARIDLRQPLVFRLGLADVAESLPDLAAATLGVRDVGVATPDQGASFYALARPRGPLAIFGVVGSSLVAASEPHRAAGIASESTRVVPGARGSLVATVDARRLARRLLAPRLRGLAALGAPLALRSLRDASLTASIDREGLHGRAKLSTG